MLIGAAVYAEVYPALKTTVLAWKDFGKIGLAEAMGISPWGLIVAFWGISLGLFTWFEKRRL